MATTAEKLASGDKAFSKELEAACDEVVQVAEQSDSYAYRFEEFSDGSAIAIYVTEPGAKPQVEAFGSLADTAGWHPVLDLSARSSEE